MNMIRTAGTFKNIAVVGAIFVAAMFGPAFGQEATHELLTDSMPELRQGSQWILSKDAEHIGFIGEIGDKQQSFFFDGKATGQYSHIRWIESRTWSMLDLGLSEFSYYVFKDKKTCVVRNGKEGKWYDYVWDVKFSRDDKHFAYIAVVGDGKDKTELVVFDDMEGPAYKYPFRIVAELAINSCGDSAIAYGVTDGKAQSFVVFNGRALGNRKGGVSSIVLSQNGKKMAYIADDGEGKYVVVDEKPASEVYDSFNDLTIDDNGDVSYIGHHSKKNATVVVKGEVITTCDFASLLRISSDNKHYYCDLSPKGFLVDGEIYKPSNSIEGYILNKKENTVAYRTKAGNRRDCVVAYDENGEVYRSPQYLSSTSLGMEFHPVNDNLATWGSRDGGMFFDYDGHEYGPYNCSRISGVVFSKDGPRFGFIASTDNAWDVVIDGQTVGTYKEVRYLKFSDDGKRAAYPAKISDTTWSVILNGKQLGEYDRVSEVWFKPDGTLIYYAQKGKNLYRVTCKADAVTAGGSSASQPTATSDPVDGKNSTRPASQPTSGPKTTSDLDDKR